MTKREFDNLTKQNNGVLWGQVTAYRKERCLPERQSQRAPLLERRAEYLARTGKSPLTVGSPLRAPAMRFRPFEVKL